MSEFDLIRNLDWKDINEEKPKEACSVLVAMEDLTIHEASYIKRYTRVGFDECVVYEGCFRIKKNLREKCSKITNWAYLNKNNLRD